MKLTEEQVKAVLEQGTDADLRLSQPQVADGILGVRPEIDEAGGFLARELHEAGICIIPATAVEAVAFRYGSAGLQVYMRERGPDEGSYPGLKHFPGSYIRYGEQTEDVLRRIGKKEGMGDMCAHCVVGTANWVDRGWLTSVITVVRAPDARETENAGWFPVDRLPENMVPAHRDLILPQALEFIQDGENHGLFVVNGLK